LVQQLVQQRKVRVSAKAKAKASPQRRNCATQTAQTLMFVPCPGPNCAKAYKKDSGHSRVMKRHLASEDGAECNAFILGLADPDEIKACVPILRQNPRDRNCSIFKKHVKMTVPGAAAVKAQKAEPKGKKQKVAA
jgi:hypothetical protein